MKTRSCGVGPTLAVTGCMAIVALGGCNTTGSPRGPAADVVTKPATEREDTTVRTKMRQCPEGLVAARRGGTTPDRYVVPSGADRGVMADLFANLAASRASTPAGLAPLAAQVGFHIATVVEMPDAVLIAELETQRRGGGAYLLRTGSASRLIVQAPHTFFDEGTLPLACELFERSQAAALFVDTAHRYKAAEMDESGNFPADVAHSKESLFQAATEGMLRALTGLTVVQIHGFGPRESGASVVLSNGVAEPSVPIVERSRLALSALGLGPIQRFPLDTSELGAKTNVQGAAVRAAGGTFLHIEIASPLRKALLSNDDLRARFLDAIARSVNAP